MKASIVLKNSIMYSPISSSHTCQWISSLFPSTKPSTDTIIDMIILLILNALSFTALLSFLRLQQTISHRYHIGGHFFNFQVFESTKFVDIAKSKDAFFPRRIGHFHTALYHSHFSMCNDILDF